ILLHAHVEEYLPCHKLVQTWLTHPDNQHSKHCAQVIRVYGEHILLPLGQFGILEDIVNSCQTLSEEEKLSLLKLPQTGRFKDAKTTSEREFVPSQLLFTSDEEENENRNNETLEDGDQSVPDENTCASSISPEGPQKPASRHLDPLNLILICKKLYCSFCGYIKSNWREKFTLLVMAAFVLWALAHTLSGDTDSLQVFVKIL
ncbi:hypothetical protein ElyMa_004718300, partial [Elysia marginata]